MTTSIRICVTGGTGYIGSRTAIALAALDHEVVVVDIVPPEERGIVFPPGITFRHHDLRIPAEAEKALREVDVVLHLAADIGSLTYMHRHQADILTNNAQIDAAVFPAARENHIRHIVYSSSSGVFQHPPKFPYTEDDIAHIKPPSNIYFFSKLLGETFCRSYGAQYRLPYTIIRYHNVFGPGEDSKGSAPGDIHVIPALLEKVYRGQYPIELIGAPDATRPFVYIEDAVDATSRILTLALEGRLDGEDFNIGHDKHYTIKELAEIIWSRFGDDRPFDTVSLPTDAHTAHRREVDIKKIREKTGWAPTTALEDGLEATMEWIRSKYSGAEAKKKEGGS